MPDALDNFLERANLTFANAFGMDAGGTFDAATAPNKLSPDQRRTIAEKYLGADEGPLKDILDFTLNPLVIVGTILTMRYPVPIAGRLLDWTNKIKSYARKEVPGLTFFKDFHELFRNTPLPAQFEHVVRTNHIHMSQNGVWMKEALEEFGKRGGKYSKETGNKIAAYLDGLGNRDNPIWGAIKRDTGVDVRDSIKAIKLSKAEQYLANEVRVLMRAQAGPILNSKVSKKSVLAQLANVGIHANDIKTIDKYLPHVQMLSREQLKAKNKQWLAQMEVSGGAYRKMQESAPGKQVSKQFGPRKYALLPDMEELKSAGIWNSKLEKAYGELRKIDDGLTSAGESPTGRYSLDLLKVYENYTRGVARTMAWSVPPDYAKGAKSVAAPIGQQIIKELKEVAQVNPVKANMLRDTYIPLATGQLAWEQAIPSMKFSQLKEVAAETLQKLPLPKQVKDILYKPLAASQNLSWQRLGSLIQGHLYITTMGFNPLSPAKNLLQSVITTAPMLGPKYTAMGMQETMKRYQKAYSLMKKGRTIDQAKREAFSEFFETGFEVDKIHLLDPIEGADGVIRMPSKIRKFMDEAGSKSLAMFTASENFNRMTAFYGGRMKALKELPGTRYVSPLTGRDEILEKGTDYLDEVAGQFGDMISRMTQFGGGPLNSPYGTLKWWQPLRQFTLFPSRVAGFVMGPALRDPRVMGRLMVGTGAAYYGAKSLMGADISDALVFGALPSLTDENKPFSPFPFVSPFLSIVGETGQAITTGDYEGLSSVVPLLVPGGVAAARATTGLAPEVAQMLGRPYADYDRPNPDGTIPVMSRNGTLIGNYSPTQLFAKSVGIGDLNSGQEQVLMKYTLAQRDEMRRFRKEFMDGLMANNIERANAVDKQFQMKYPGFGTLRDWIKESDIESMQMRREIPRLEQLLATLPPQQRAAFAGIIATSMGAGAGNFLGSDPSLWGQGTPRSRRAGSAGHGANTTIPNTMTMPSQARGMGSQMGPGQLQRLATQRGEQTRDRLADQGYAAFDSY